MRVWDLRSRKEPLEFSGHNDIIHDIDFSKNNLYLATASKDKYAIIWDTTKADILHKLQLPECGMSIRFSPERKRLAVGSLKGAILFDTDSGEKVYDFNLDDNTAVFGLDFLPDGKK